MNKTYSIISTGWGYAAAAWSDTGLWKLTFPFPQPGAAVAALAIDGLEEDNGCRWQETLSAELNRYFQGFAVEFSAPVDWRGYTPFQASVLKYTAGIPYGTVLSYGEVAREIKAPRAARAVGGALHINRTPVVVPCHRVIAAGGSLGGFGGGLELKKALLLLEQCKD